MILLRGISNSQEYKAAELIKDSLVELWPDVENATREEASILIISNCPIGGYKVGDFDIIVLASFKRLKFNS